MPTRVTQIISSTPDATVESNSPFSQARRFVRQIPQSAKDLATGVVDRARATGQAVRQVTGEIATGNVGIVGELAVAARTSAEQAIVGREDAPRYNDIDRVSNPGRGHQYSLNQGGIVTANAAGDVVGSAALGNTIPLNTSEVLMNPDEGSAIWQVARTC